MRFLADMGVDYRVVTWLNLQGHDATHLRDQGLQRLADDNIFEKAIAEERIVLTFDLDFGEVAAMSIGRLTSVVLFRLQHGRHQHVISRLTDVLADCLEALEQGAVVVVEESRHRVRILPIGRESENPEL